MQSHRAVADRAGGVRRWRIAGAPRGIGETHVAARVEGAGGGGKGGGIVFCVLTSRRPPYLSRSCTSARVVMPPRLLASTLPFHFFIFSPPSTDDRTTRFTTSFLFVFSPFFLSLVRSEMIPAESVKQRSSGTASMLRSFLTSSK